MNDVPEKSALLIYEGGESRLLVTHKEFLSVRREREWREMIAYFKPYTEYKESGLPWLGQVFAH